jgi:hypothetical protein
VYHISQNWAIGIKFAESRGVSRVSEELQALQRELSEVRENLALIHERISQFVLSTDVPLQLIKEERFLTQRFRWLERQIEELRPINLLRRAVKLLVGPVAVALTGEPWKALRQRLLTQASKLPHRAHLDVPALEAAASELPRLVHESQILLEAYRIEPNPGQLEALERRAALLTIHLLRIYHLSPVDWPELRALAGDDKLSP